MRLGGIRGYICPGNFEKNQVVEVHFFCILKVVLILSLPQRTFAARKGLQTHPSQPPPPPPPLPAALACAESKILRMRKHDEPFAFLLAFSRFLLQFCWPFSQPMLNGKVSAYCKRRGPRKDGLSSGKSVKFLVRGSDSAAQ